jgi:hypothetical protein
MKQLNDELSRPAIGACRISLHGGTGEREWFGSSASGWRRSYRVNGSPEAVSIKFIRDVRFGDGSVDYSSGSQWWADAATASALIVVGAAVRVPVQ